MNYDFSFSFTNLLFAIGASHAFSHTIPLAGSERGLWNSSIHSFSRIHSDPVFRGIVNSWPGHTRRFWLHSMIWAVARGVLLLIETIETLVHHVHEHTKPITT